MTIEFENILTVSNDFKELIRTWRNSKHVSQYMITDHYITKKEHEQWIEKLKTQTTTKAWIIFYNRKPIGLVSLSNFDTKKKSTEWGFYIADESARGKGIGSTALFMLMKYVFDALLFHTMKTSVLENNPQAIQLYKKFGFTEDETQKQHLKRNGKIINIITMSTSRNTWECVKGTIQPLQASDIV